MNCDFLDEVIIRKAIKKGNIVKQEPVDDHSAQLLPSTGSSPLKKESESNAGTEPQGTGPWSLQTSFGSSVPGISSIVEEHEFVTQECTQEVTNMSTAEHDDIIDGIISSFDLPEDEQNKTMRAIFSMPKVQTLGANLQDACLINQNMRSEQPHIQQSSKDYEATVAIIGTVMLLDLDAKNNAKALTKIMPIGKKYNQSN